MATQTTLRWNSLKCIQPNESGDEPYLWAYFWKLDGDTVRQPAANVDAFISTAAVRTAAGSHGNIPLGKHPYAVPSAIGQFSADLRPIRMQVGPNVHMIPGQIWCFLALMEEDETGDAAMEAAHQEMRQHIESAIHAAVASIQPGALRAGVLALGPPDATAWSRGLADAFMARIDAAANGFGATLRDKVNEHASDDESFFDPASWDWDECLGTHVFRQDEMQLRAATRQDFYRDFIATADGRWDSYYELTGSLESRATGSGVAITQLGSTSTSTVVRTGTGTSTRNAICMQEGTTVPWELRQNQESETLLLSAPLTAVAWSIEGVPLAPAGGTVTVTRTVRHPQFDLNAGDWVAYTTETRAVTIRYAFVQSGQSTELRLSNTPADGNYLFDVWVHDSTAPAGIVLGTQTVAFSGESIFSPARAGFDDCLGNIFGKMRYKEPTLLDLWGPTDRVRLYDQVVREADRRVRAGLLPESRLDAIQTSMQRVLRINVGPR